MAVQQFINPMQKWSWSQLVPVMLNSEDAAVRLSGTRQGELLSIVIPQFLLTGGQVMDA